MDSLEQERDFYFAKLREIEILCTDASLGNNQVVKAVQTILYATEEYDIAGLIQQAASSPAKAAQEPKTEAAMAATAAAAGEKSAEPAIGDSVTAGTPELAKSADKSIDGPQEEEASAQEPQEAAAQAPGLVPAPLKENVAPQDEQLARKAAKDGAQDTQPRPSLDFNKSPLLPCQDCNVNFLEDSGMDLLKTSPFTLHNA